MQFLIADSSFVIGCKELKLGESAQINQLFQFLHIICIYSDVLYFLTRILMSKNVNIDISKDSLMKSVREDHLKGGIIDAFPPKIDKLLFKCRITFIQELYPGNVLHYMWPPETKIKQLFQSITESVSYLSSSLILPSVRIKGQLFQAQESGYFQLQSCIKSLKTKSVLDYNDK